MKEFKFFRGIKLNGLQSEIEQELFNRDLRAYETFITYPPDITNPLDMTMYDEGWVSYLRGNHYNPYDLDTVAFDIWHRGYTNCNNYISTNT